MEPLGATESAWLSLQADLGVTCAGEADQSPLCWPEGFLYTPAADEWYSEHAGLEVYKSASSD